MVFENFCDGCIIDCFLVCEVRFCQYVEGCIWVNRFGFEQNVGGLFWIEKNNVGLEWFNVVSVSFDYC